MQNDAGKIFSTNSISNIKSFEVAPLSNDNKNEELIRDSIDDVRNQNWQIKSDHSGAHNDINFDLN